MAPLPVSTEPNYLLARVSIVRLASLATPYHRSPSSPRKVARMTTSPSEPGTPARRQLLTRRNLIASTGLVAAAVTAAPLLGRGTAEAAEGAEAAVPPAGGPGPRKSLRGRRSRSRPRVPAGNHSAGPAAGQGPGHPQVRLPGRGDRRPRLLAD